MLRNVIFHRCRALGLAGGQECAEVGRGRRFGRHDRALLNDRREIARPLNHSVEDRPSRNANQFRSALSMLTFYINRAGNTCPLRGAKPEIAKDELRQAFGKSTRSGN
jgi:Protein of unknown function (DUF3175)